MNGHEDISSDDLGLIAEASGLCGGDGQMSCDKAAELIQLYLDAKVAGATPDAAVELMRDHMGLCAPCETEFAVYERISVSLTRCRPALPPETKQRLERFCSDLCSGDIDGS